MTVRRKLIEVALPLEAINRESAREKSIRHGHPSTLHLWWSRKPLATARAVLFAQLVDDPSSHPDRFPTEEAQKAERDRLHRLIEELVTWENISNENLFARAHQEILNSTEGNPPPILDPFAGGGSIPLEAQRLGLEAHASDLNPVAVLINKALIEIPPRFRDQPPVFPGLSDTRAGWRGAEGLAADVRAYGQWMREEAERRIGHLYPKAKLPDGSEAAVIAWIWARTVTCPNPACGIEMPLTSKWWLGRKKAREVYVIPTVVTDPVHASGKRVEFAIGHGSRPPLIEGTVGRDGAICVACGTIVQFAQLRAAGQRSQIGQTLMVVVAEGHRRRVYLTPDDKHSTAAAISAPADVPLGDLPEQALGFRVQAYGLTKWAHLYTNRQLVALATFTDLVGLAREKILEDGGSSSYGDAVATYLGMTISKLADRNSSLVPWDSSAKQEAPSHVFTRQAVTMTWEFAEANPFGTSTGNWLDAIKRLAVALENLPSKGSGAARQANAKDFGAVAQAVSTDPPYYDNIGYSDLSDFFYVWLRASLREIYPDLFGTLLVPKSDELVANAHRHGGQEAAKAFFEEGFRHVFAMARRQVAPALPITVYYAFKQSEASINGISSSGWETLLDGMVHSGWRITATWPIRSELGNRVRSQGSNALATSIVLALRPRPETASTTNRRGFIAALQAELPDALRNLQQGLIAPVDLPQAAIGPGMAVFSRYSSVIEADGSPMTVRSALARINEILDQVLNEQEGDFDAATRFAIAWYRQHGFSTGAFGDADNLARARNTSVEVLDRSGVLVSRGGKVALIKPADLPPDYDVTTDQHPSVWEAAHNLIRILETQGIPAAGQFLVAATGRADGAVQPDLVKELAFLLFPLAEKNGWTKDALAYNTLATSWSDIVDASRIRSASDQDQLFDAGANP